MRVFRYGECPGEGWELAATTPLGYPIWENKKRKEKMKYYVDSRGVVHSVDFVKKCGLPQ